MGQKHIRHLSSIIYTRPTYFPGQEKAQFVTNNFYRDFWQYLWAWIIFVIKSKLLLPDEFL